MAMSRKPAAPRKPKFEGSPQDRRDDRANAKKFGMTLREYERSPQDKKKDAAGQKKLDMKRKSKP